MKDFLGNEYTEGDIVVYPAMSGRSVALRKAEVVRFTEKGNLVLRPIGGSRWNKGETGKTFKLINTKTGKGIHPYNEQHIERDSGYVHKLTGEYRTYKQMEEARYINQAEVDAWYKRYGQRWTYPHGRPELKRNPEHNDRDWEYTGPVYKDYIQKVEADGPTVTIYITENVIKVADG